MFTLIEIKTKILFSPWELKIAQFKLISRKTQKIANYRNYTNAIFGAIAVFSRAEIR